MDDFFRVYQNWNIRKVAHVRVEHGHQPGDASVGTAGENEDLSKPVVYHESSPA